MPAGCAFLLASENEVDAMGAGPDELSALPSFCRGDTSSKFFCLGVNVCSGLDTVGLVGKPGQVRTGEGWQQRDGSCRQAGHVELFGQQ